MKYSFIVPIYNDGYLAVSFCKAFEISFTEYLNEESIIGIVELIFVNDGSKDNSLSILKSLPENFNFVKIVDLSRNFGQHIALTCGYNLAQGDYIGMLNVDMQEPPSEIPILIEFMKSEKHDIVFGITENRQTTFLNRITSKAFGKTLNYLTKTKTPLNVTTLRVMNRKFIIAYNTISEKSRYIPGLEAWLGFSQGFVPIKHQKRIDNRSSYNFKKRIGLALETIISFSDFPLRLIVSLGFLFALLGFILSMVLIICKLVFIDFQSGYTSTISFVLLIGGIQILVVGVSSLYIGRILKEVQNRPLYLINEKINFND
jgi:dolichol-phosphate mannosyltransferase